MNVAAASSLSYLSEKVISPSFTKAEGYKYTGTYNASGDLESDIASGDIHPNVFESVGADNITPLEPKFTKWYVQYAGTSMVVAYNPKSKYASQFKAARGDKATARDLAQELLTQGKATRDDFKLRFMALKLASELAAGAGDNALALEAISELNQSLLRLDREQAKDQERPS